jgi:sialate O-acetylesterase
VGYFFAREISRELDVPVGLLNDCSGGTRIEWWTPLEGFQLEAAEPEIKEIIHSVEAARQIPPPPPPPGPRRKAEPTDLFNGSIAPVIPYAIRGAIWYQGETNGGDDAISYLHKMKALVGGWRQLWGEGDFPFYYAQLTNYETAMPGWGGWERLRLAQLMSLVIPNTGMAVIIDIGDANNVHPKNKQDVGKRLALWALAKTYGKNVAFSGPIYKSCAIEGNKVRVSFDHVGSGLMVGVKNGLDPVREVKNGKLKWFALLGEDKVWYWGDAVIDGDTVVVTSSDVKVPSAVRYAYVMNPAGANFYTKEGLPDSPFSSDNGQ